MKEMIRRKKIFIKENIKKIFQMIIFFDLYNYSIIFSSDENNYSN